MWLGGLPVKARDTIVAIADQFKHGGTEDLENNYLFQNPEVELAGGIRALETAGDPATLIRETKERIFAA